MIRLLTLVLCFVLCACVKEPETNTDLDVIKIPLGFPELEFPEDNAFTYERWSLGKSLFFDPILSRDSSISCSNCHMPELAFTDGLAKAKGVDERIGRRNSPGLANIAYHPYFTREGGVPSLEMQILVPIQEHDEFDFNIVLIADRLNSSDNYRQLSQAAYQRLPDPYVITRALANFERSLLSGNSRYDKYLNGEISLTASEIKGMQLFNSERLACSKCHSGFDFSDYGFKNNGLYTAYEDLGRYRLTGDSMDLAMFKTPGLRNVELTAPYMHDGSFNSLEDIILHYSSGGKEHKNKSPLINGFEITEQEMKDLISFLNTLTDYEFIENPIFKIE
jgi:cytochrome c peroxidase